MTIGDLVRGLLGKRRQDALPSSNPTPAQPAAARAVTEQELEQVEGGASVGAFPITSVPYATWGSTPSIGNPNLRTVSDPQE